MFNLIISLFSYTIGIFSSYYNMVSFNTLLALAIIPISLYLIRNKNIFIHTLLSFLFFCIGIYNYDFQKYTPKENDISFYTPIKVDIDGVINSEIKKTDRFTMFDLNLSKVNNFNLKLSGNIFVIIENNKSNNLNYGDKILLKGKIDTPKEAYNYGEFSFKEYLSRKNIFSVMNASEIIVIENSYKIDWYSKLIDIRKKILSPIYKYLPNSYSSLLSSLIFGSKATSVDKDIENSFRNLGLSHALAASGMQIVLIINLSVFLTFFMKKNSIYQKIIISLPVIFYMFLTDFPASIVRAGIINLLILFLKKDDKVVDTLNTFLFGTLIIIIVSPLIIFDIGFQFSLLATLGLIIISPSINKKISFFIPSFLAEIISIIISAQLMVLPLQLYYFQEFSLMFLIGNLIGSLFIDLLTYIGIFFIFLEFTIPNLAYYFSIIIKYIISLFLYIVNFLSDNSILIKISKPSLFNIFYIYIFILISLLKVKKKILIIFISVFLLFNIINKYNYDRYLKVDFLYVGQGNSTFIETPNKKNILVDCGVEIKFTKDNKLIKSSAGEKIILPFLKRKGIDKIDILILTHPDNDHIGGCNDIINNIEVKEVWDSSQIDESKTYSDLLANILSKNIDLKTENLNYIENNIELKAFNLGFKSNEKSYNNNNALIVDINFLKNRFLLMSDIEIEGENKLLNTKYDLKSDVLQVGHHGSRTSSSSQFLAKVKPEISIISAGKNNIYKHPHSEVLERVNLFSNKVLRTDKSGEVSLYSDGFNIKVRTFKKNMYKS